MTRTIRQLSNVDRVLPSRSGRTCRVLCPILVGIAALGGCAADDGNSETCTAPTRLRIDRVAIPTNNTAAREAAFDLDGNKTVDNLAGMLAGTLYGQIVGFELSTAATTRFANDVTWQIAVSACGDEAAVAIGPEVEELTLAGHRDSETGRVLATGIDGQMPISTLWDPTAGFPAAGWLPATRVAIELAPLGDGRWEGRVGMGFVPDELIAAVVQPIAPYFDEHQLFMDYLDAAPKDGRITVEEMTGSRYVKSLLAPDLTRGLGTSFAIRFSALEQR